MYLLQMKEIWGKSVLLVESGLIEELRNWGNVTAMQEVGNIQQQACKNRMKLNQSKTWEMVLRGKTTKQVPDALPSIVLVACT